MKQFEDKNGSWCNRFFNNKSFRRNFNGILLLISIVIAIPNSVLAVAGSTATELSIEDYQNYQQRFESIKTKEQITTNGFKIIEEQIFPLMSAHYGEVHFVPALDNQYDRFAVFLVRNDGTVIYKTEQLSTNNQNYGELRQSNKGIVSVSFHDVNGNGLTDILLITLCEKKDSSGIKQTYKVGDVLFQQSSASKQAFYRDYRISDKLNQYGMNKSTRFMTSYLIEGHSTEFLYTADTIDELLEAGFQIITEQSYWREFEKWGRLRVVPGTYRVAEYSILMLYLINEQGYIVWSFQPMGDCESLYALRGIVCKDINGDGMKDIVVLGRYISEEMNDESVITSDYSVYYQGSGGFYEDTEVKEQYPCNDEDTVQEIVDKLRTYWGWN